MPREATGLPLDATSYTGWQVLWVRLPWAVFFWLSAIFKIFVDKAFVQGSTDEIQTMLSNVGPTDHRRDAQRPATREAGRHDAAALFALVSVTKFHS